MKRPKFYRDRPDPEREPLFAGTIDEAVKAGAGAFVRASSEAFMASVKDLSPETRATVERAMASFSAADPPTSEAAAKLVEARGIASDHRRRCLAAVLRAPGSTAAEIAEATGLERHEPSRRLPELRKLGLVESRAARKCSVLGSRQITWWPVLRGA